jgi:hypothetical protein
LANHPDPQIRTWLDGLQHTTNLMTHTVRQMMTASATRETTHDRQNRQGTVSLNWPVRPLLKSGLYTRACYPRCTVRAPKHLSHSVANARP